VRETQDGKTILLLQYAALMGLESLAEGGNV
jgi:hypothetical protein